ncbi:hypothetical protein ACFW5G_26635 [Streptomyces griseoaurantiacus]|uniref:hypothetical protein n=1 Tax=Streptomyces griseoaurantiacus TaxID=68213 RepID=UPI0036AD8C33
MDGSLAAIIGAAVGAVGGLGGGWVSVVGQARHHRAQQLADRVRWRDEMRREAYVAYLAAARQLNASWWKVSDHLAVRESSPAEWQEALTQTHDAWAAFSTAAAAVAVAGPEAVVAAASELHGVMRQWEMVGVDWARAAIRNGTSCAAEYQARFEAAASAKQIPFVAFQQAARAVLGTEL